MESDEELVARLRVDDAAARAELCQRYWSAVGRFFDNKADQFTDDLRQETFTRCFVAVARFEGRSSLRSFVLGIAAKVFYEFLRKKQRNKAVELDECSIADLGLPISSLLRRRVLQQQALRALRRVPLRMQMVLELSYFENMGDREIGETLSMNPNTVRSTLHRARARLKEELQRVIAGEAAATDGDAALSHTPTDFHAWEMRILREIHPEVADL